jgi:hypothetical protein
VAASFIGGDAFPRLFDPQLKRPENINCFSNNISLRVLI